MKIRNFNKFSLMALALVMALVLVPTGAWAAEGNIFNIISAKMISTIQDVRKIVYVIAGFGLIMFAVLAIFNKISFKHLAYIMIGLSLLAVMMPFINYFSGANLEDSEYSYGNFIAGGDASITGSDITKQDGIICRGDNCPDGLAKIDTDDLLKGQVELSTDGLGIKLPGVGGYDANGCRMVDGKQECCEGKVKNGVCKKSFGQTLKDIVNVGKTIVAAGQGAVNAVEYGMSTVGAIKDTVNNVGDIISGDGNIIDKIGNLASSVGGSLDTISSGANSALGSLGGAIGNVGSVGDQIRGDDKWSEDIANSGVMDTIEGAKDTIEDARDAGREVTNATGDLYGSYKDAEGMADRVGDWFDGNK